MFDPIIKRDECTVFQRNLGPKKRNIEGHLVYFVAALPNEAVASGFGVNVSPFQTYDGMDQISALADFAKQLAAIEGDALRGMLVVCSESDEPHELEDCSAEHWSTRRWYREVVRGELLHIP